MSVTLVRRIGRGRRATLDSSGNRTYAIPFLVKAAASDGQADIIGILGTSVGGVTIPTLGTTYAWDSDTDTTAKVVSHDIEQMDEDKSSKWWTVTVNYSSEAGSLRTPGPPTSRPARYSFGFAQFSKVLEQDVDGNPVTNTAGIKFDPPLEVDWSRPLLRITKYISSTNFAFWAQKAEEYQDAINSDTFLYWAARKVKITNLSIGELDDVQGTFCHPLSLELQFNRDGWRPKVPNMSRKVKVNGQPNLPPVYLVDAETRVPTVDPVFITMDGTAFSPTPTYVEVKAYKELPFNPFISGLGISF